MKKWGTPRRRVARSAGPGNPLSWADFSPCEGGVTRLAGVNSEFRQNNMAANQYKPDELTADFIFKTSRKSCNEENSEEVDGASDNLSLGSDNRADLLNQTEVLIARNNNKTKTFIGSNH